MNSEEQFKIDLEICPTPLLLVSEDGEIVKSNSQMDTLFGYEPNELHGNKVEVLVPEHLRKAHPGLRQAFLDVPASRKMGTGRDLHAVRKNGEMLPVEVGLEPIEFGDKKMIMVSVIDIRERKNNESMMRSALDSALSAMIQVDAKGKIELVNRQAVNLFGYEKDEMLGRSIEILVPERYRMKHSVYRNSYQSKRETRSMGTGRPLFGLRKDGSEFPIEIGLTPINESLTHSTMATIIDVTSIRYNEKLIQQKNEQLRRLNTELLEFAFSTSHDLKAPLTSIMGLMQFCESDLEDGDIDEVRSNLKKIKLLAERLADRVESTLSLAKSDISDGQWEEVDVRDRCMEAWSSLPTDGIELETNFDHEEPTFSVATRFDIVLENLLSNAIKFNDSDKPKNWVKVSTWTSEEGFCLSVADNGIGISKDQQEKVFRMFHRIVSDETEGTGLGLPFVKKNILIMGGSIDLQSDDGVTKFTVTLPQEKPLSDNEDPDRE